MKIGILTYHKSINYGSALQAWATLSFLQNEGFDAEIIDYEPESFNSQYQIFNKKITPKNIIKNIFRVPIAGIKRRQIKDFSDFKTDRMTLSKESYSPYSNLKLLEEKYDCIICGSDQIWNVHAKDCDDIYFLPEIQTRKIAFAVSINSTDYTEERCNSKMKEWILDYDLISCREKTGAERIADFIGHKKDVFTLLDPTLLHTKNDYLQICKPDTLPANYIFMYKVWSGKDTYKLVADIGKKLDMPIYTILMLKDILGLCKVEKNGIKVLKKELGPEHFLTYIRNASYVVTDSFHGTAFSIIFEKPFISVREKKPDGCLKNDERITNLLKLLGITERYLSLYELSEFDYTKAINYSIVTEKRIKLANETKKILLNALNEEKEKNED